MRAIRSAGFLWLAHLPCEGFHPAECFLLKVKWSIPSKARTVRLCDLRLHVSCVRYFTSTSNSPRVSWRRLSLYELSDPREIYLSQVSRALHRLARLHPTHTGRGEDSGFGSSSGVPGTTLRILMRSSRPVLHLSHALRRDFFFRNL